MDRTTFAAQGLDPAPLKDRSDTTFVKLFVPSAFMGRVSYEGGPWSSFGIYTPPAIFDVGGSAGSGPTVIPQLAVYLDDERRFYPYTGQLYKGIGSFRRITLVDQRTVRFIPIECDVLLSNDPDLFVFNGWWL